MNKDQEIHQGEIDSEPDVVVLSADFLCAMVAYGDRKFAKQDSERQKAVAK